MRYGDADLMRALVRILGPVGVVGAGGEVELGGPKERCLLTVLTLHAGAVVAEDRLVEALWMGSPPRTAAKTLQNYVLRLRRRLEGCGDAAIVTRPPGYVLEGLTTDAAAARALVADGRRLAERGEHAAAIATFDEALALWRGPALAEFADRPFARTEAAGLDELRASIAEERMAAILAAGGRRDAVAECEKLVAEEPLRERRWAQLMIALYRDGRQGEALEACRRLRVLLADELGVDPGPEVRRLEAAILVQDPALGRRETVTGTDRGSARDVVFRSGAGAGDAARPSGGRVGGPGACDVRVAASPASARAGCSPNWRQRAASRGAQVLVGRCLEGAGALPFHPFVEAVEAFLDGRPPPGVLGHLLHDGRTQGGRALQPDELRLRLLDGMARFLVGCGAERPVLLVVDDLHWADEGTVAMVRHVARSTPGHRLLVVGAYRGSEVPTDISSPTPSVRCAARRSAACCGWPGSTGRPPRS